MGLYLLAYDIRGVRFSWSQENPLYLETSIGTVLVKSE